MEIISKQDSSSLVCWHPQSKSRASLLFPVTWKLDGLFLSIDGERVFLRTFIRKILGGEDNFFKGQSKPQDGISN